MGFLNEIPKSEAPDEVVDPGTIRVILADSQAIYRVGIHKILALEDDTRVVAHADSLDELRVAVGQHTPDVVLVERELLAGASSSIPELQAIAPGMKLIVQTDSAEEARTVELYRRGIRGIISRSISPDLLVKCVRCIGSGETWIDNQALNWVIQNYRAQQAVLQSPRPQSQLTPKEIAIITCVTKGLRNKEIAFELRTTEQVIKNYLRKIYDKLGVTDRLELAIYSLEKKLVSADADEIAILQTARQRA